MTSPRLAHRTRIVRDQTEWFRHARMSARIHIQWGYPLVGRPGGKALRRWYMLGRQIG